MKKLTLLICVLAILLSLTGVASASPRQPKKFRIKGHTIDFVPIAMGDEECTVWLMSQGKVIRHIHGTFKMDEFLHFHKNCGALVWDFIMTGDMPTPYSNIGSTLTIWPKKGGEVGFSFDGGTDGETVSGTFYTGETEVGQYEGVIDDCDLYIPPEGGLPSLVCTGFYVDFTFDTDQD